MVYQDGNWGVSLDKMSWISEPAQSLKTRGPGRRKDMRLEPKAVLPFLLRACLLALVLSQHIQPALDFAPSRGKAIFPLSVPLFHNQPWHIFPSDLKTQIPPARRANFTLSICFNLLYNSATVAFIQAGITSYSPSCLLLVSLKTT